MQRRPQPAIDQRGFAAAGGADHGQKTRGGKLVDHGVDLAFPAEEQMLLVLPEWPQPGKRIGRAGWLTALIGASRCERGLIALAKAGFGKPVEAIDQSRAPPIDQVLLVRRFSARPDRSTRRQGLAAPVARHLHQFGCPSRVSKPRRRRRRTGGRHRRSREALVGLANLGGVALEGRKHHFKVRAARTTCAWERWPCRVLHVADKVDQLCLLSAAAARSGAARRHFRFLRLRLLDLLQCGVDRGSSVARCRRQSGRRRTAPPHPCAAH